MHRITTAPAAPIPARTRWAVAAGVGAALAAAWWLGDTAPYPYAQRGLLDVPLPFLTADRMDAVLQPRPGERILEIGPGTGLQSLHVAPRLGPEGRLDVLDIQQEMLDHVMWRAERDGLATIRPTRSDARELPYADGTFDAVYAVTALGEIPEPDRVLAPAIGQEQRCGPRPPTHLQSPHLTMITAGLSHLPTGPQSHLRLVEGPFEQATSFYDCVIRSRNQESTPLSAVLAIAVGWLVKPWGDSG